MSRVVSGRRVRQQVSKTAQVRQVRRETGGARRRAECEDATAAAGFPSLSTSEIKRDSAASLGAKTLKQCITLGFAARPEFLLTVCRLPGRDAAGDRPSPASKLCSRCLNTSLGLKDLWEISALAS